MKTVALLSRSYLSTYPEEAVRVLEKHDARDVAALLEQHPPDVVAGLLGSTIPLIAAGYLAHLSPSIASQVIMRLDAEHAVRMLRHMSVEPREQVIETLPASSGGVYRRLLQYPPDCAGAHLNPFVVVLPEDLTVAEAMRRVRKLSREAFYFPYVVDRDQKLVGIITVRELMLAGVRQRLVSIMRRDVVRVSALATAIEITRIPGVRAYQSLPVVDTDGTLIGVLRHDALREMEARSSPVVSGPQLTDGLIAVGELYVRTLAALMPLMVNVAAGLIKPTRGGAAHHVI